MSLERIERELLDLEQRHKTDRDGGYGLAAAMCTHRTGLSEQGKRYWDEALVEWVATKPPEYWSVALESLARSGSHWVTEQLAILLKTAERGDEWSEALIFTLLRRGYIDRFLREKVIQNAKLRRPMSIPNVAAASSLDPSMIDLAATCFAEAISSGDNHYVESSVPPFVHAAFDSQPDMLVRLLKETQSKSAVAGDALLGFLVSYLEMPFSVKRFGELVIRRLVAELKGVRV